MEGETDKIQVNQSRKITSDGDTSSKEDNHRVKGSRVGGHGRNLGSGHGTLRVNQSLPHYSLRQVKPGAAVVC